MIVTFSNLFLGSEAGWLAIFCAPVLGIREAVLIAVAAVVLLGMPILAVLRRIRRENERLEEQERKARKLPPPSEAPPPNPPVPRKPPRS